MWITIYRTLLKPRSRTEDNRRREFILNILLLGMIVLSVCATFSATTDVVTKGTTYSGTALLPLLAVSAVFSGLLLLSRKGFFRVAVYPFIGLLFLFATYPIVIWGILVPQAVLTYSLIIVMSGVLISSRAALRTTLLIVLSLFFIERFQYTGQLELDTSWMQQKGSYNDVVVFGITFLILALVTWLSNREIEGSLKRARKSEHALRVERNSLEVKVKERTKELEKAQVEKMLELNRFAEFGRVSSALLHELANPLTAMSLHLEQLEGKKQPKLIKQVRESITFMEEYVDNARRQLRKQSDIKSFDSATEIRRVVSFIDSKARVANIKIETELVEDVALLGDSTRFSQIIANLMVNAIDAYTGVVSKSQKKIVFTSKKREGTLRVCVRDYGKGIAPNELDRIFDPFFTTKASNRGTGLGLTITKRAVEEDFQGKIEVTSSKRRGTNFVVTLPLP